LIGPRIEHASMHLLGWENADTTRVVIDEGHRRRGEGGSGEWRQRSGQCRGRGRGRLRLGRLIEWCDTRQLDWSRGIGVGGMERYRRLSVEPRHPLRQLRGVSRELESSIVVVRVARSLGGASQPHERVDSLATLPQ
jgi:hypothetical protein